MSWQAFYLRGCTSYTGIVVNMADSLARLTGDGRLGFAGLHIACAKGFAVLPRPSRALLRFGSHGFGRAQILAFDGLESSRVAPRCLGEGALRMRVADDLSVPDPGPRKEAKAVLLLNR